MSAIPINQPGWGKGIWFSYWQLEAASCSSKHVQQVSRGKSTSTTAAGSMRPACSHKVRYLLVICFSPLPNLIAKQIASNSSTHCTSGSGFSSTKAIQSPRVQWHDLSQGNPQRDWHFTVMLTTSGVQLSLVKKKERCFASAGHKFLPRFTILISV